MGTGNPGTSRTTTDGRTRAGVTPCYGSIRTLSRTISERPVGSWGKAHRRGTVDLDGAGFCWDSEFGDELCTVCTTGQISVRLHAGRTITTMGFEMNANN